MLIDLYNRFSHLRVFWFIYIMMYVAILLTTVIGYCSFVHVHPPISNIDTVITSIRRQETIEVSITSRAVIDADFAGSFYREIIHIESGRSYEFGGLHKHFIEGDCFKTKTYLLPGNAPSGLYMLKTFIMWKPLLSINEHMSELPPVRFKICAKFEEC